MTMDIVEESVDWSLDIPRNSVRQLVNPWQGAVWNVSVLRGSRCYCGSARRVREIPMMMIGVMDP